MPPKTKQVKEKKRNSDEEAYTPAKAKKAKKEKDPDGPKRPTSSFFLYQKERRDALKKEKPDLNFGEIAKEMTKEWKEMGEEEKQKYE